MPTPLTETSPVLRFAAFGCHGAKIGIGQMPDESGDGNVWLVAVLSEEPVDLADTWRPRTMHRRGYWCPDLERVSALVGAIRRSPDGLNLPQEVRYAEIPAADFDLLVGVQS